MDKQRLETFLTEFYDWCYPLVSSNSDTERVRPADRCQKEFRMDFYEKSDMGPRVIELKKTSCLQPCDWCKKIVNQHTTHRRLIDKGKFISWQHECNTCHKIYDPKTGGLIGKNAKSVKAAGDQARLAWYNDPDYKG